MYKLKFLTISIILLMLLSLLGSSFDVSAAHPIAASNPGLGTAANSSILSTTLLTNSGSSSTNRDVDVSPLLQVQPVGLTVGGAFHSADGVAAGVLADARAADLNMLGQPLTSNQGPALDGLTLVSGVYDVGAMQLNGGVLTLNGPGIYIFRASSSAVSSGTINFINGARPCDLFWHVDTLATLNGSSFAGTIIAGTGIHFGDSVTLNGRALAINGDVTLLNDTITGPSCPARRAPTPTRTPVGPTSVPGPKPKHTSVPVVGLPETGGAPIRNEDFPWSVAIFGGFSAIVLILGIQIHRRTHLPKQ
jgi:hypothetical protein